MSPDLNSMYSAMTPDEQAMWVRVGLGLLQGRALPHLVRVAPVAVLRLVQNPIGNDIERPASGIVSKAVGG